MNRILQRTILFTCFLFVAAVNIRAQQNRFIYIQSENKQLFYIKQGDKLFSSSDAGYLIIPQLTEGSYELSLSFPKNEWPQQTIACIVKEADLGFLLKNFGDKGWGFTNMQSEQVIMAKKDAVINPAPLFEMATDSFSIILASVVNDPGILKRPVAVKDTQAVVANETNAADKPVPVKEEKKLVADQKKEMPVASVSEIKKLKQESIAGALNITYLDIINNKADTVLVFIPAVAASKTIKPLKPKETQAKDSLASAKDSRFIDMELPNPNLKNDTGVVVADTLGGGEMKKAVQNAKCKQEATSKDFRNLRKQMAAEANDNSMINVALKKFRSTCFSTEQVRNLGSLFLGDEGKYKLYVAAYPFVSDLPEFASLQNELKDEYYISRFKAMLR